MSGNGPERLVGWFDRKELDQVCQGLFGDDINHKRAAVDRISVWKSRLINRLPVAIVCTCELVRAELTESAAHLTGTHRSRCWDLRLLYSMALIRFVNLLTEKGQTSYFQKSVHHLAGNLGMPEWLVDLRHDATHSSLPSLPLLKQGVHWALNWLKTEYWLALLGEDESEDSGTDVPFCQASVADLLVQYMQEKFQPGCSQPPVAPMLQTLQDFTQQDREMVLDVLCQEGYLLPTTEQCESLKISDTAKMEVIPKALYNFWKPVLHTLDQMNVISDLLSLLVSRAHKKGKISSWAVLWIKSLLLAVSGEELNSSHRYIQPLSGTICKESFLREILANPCRRSKQLLQHFCHCYPDVIRHKTENQLLCLLNLMTAPGEACSSDSVHQVADIVARKDEGKMDDTCESRDPSASRQSWVLDTDPRWTSCPLGSVPGQDFTFSSLMINILPDTCSGQREASDSTTAQVLSSQEEEKRHVPHPCISLHLEEIALL